MGCIRFSVHLFYATSSNNKDRNGHESLKQRAESYCNEGTRDGVYYKGEKRTEPKVLPRKNAPVFRLRGTFVGGATDVF